MRACTIVARNYVPAARLLARSFLEHHPDSSFTVLLLDAVEPEASGGFEILSPYDIGIERREVHRMAMVYDVKELATAVKPWLLRTLLAGGSADAAVYLDPDTEIFAPLDDVGELARQHSIVLTPHITEPLPADGLLPDDVMILQAGTYNLGFIAVGQGAGDFLDWWSARLARDCLVAVDRGQFVDQRWVDLVPVLFDHTVLRDRTCNVAYWNLHERSLELTEARYEVDGRPLRFFHYSGFDPTKPKLLSTHLGRWARIALSERPDLARLCDQYGQRLLDAGYVSEKSLPYRYDALPGGVSVDSRMRKMYRQALERSARDGRPEPPDPFDPASARAFVDWLNEPVGPGGLSRYLHALYRDRPDLQAIFPLVGNVHRDRFLAWVVTFGRHEASIPPELLPASASQPATRVLSRIARAGVGVDALARSAAARYPALSRLAPAYDALRRVAGWRHRRSLPDPSEVPPGLALDVAPTPRPGINAVGYLRAELGVGELARRLITGVEHAAVPYSTITYRNTVSRQAFPFEGREPQRAPYDTNVVCVNADQMALFAGAAGPAFFADRYTIGVWSWELETFPATFHGAFDLVDEVWVPTDFMRSAIAPETTKPVQTVPVPLEAPAVRPVDRASLGLPDSFLFLFTFDFLSVAERKNPLGVVAAFQRAFEPGEGAALAIKAINGDLSAAALEALRAAAGKHRDVVIMDGYLSAEQKDGLMAACDCYVSLHRSEGLGFTLAEAMSYGKPVIATGYSGNLAFMDEENSYLVPYTLTHVPEGCDPYPAGAHWAEPDLEGAASLMRHVYENQDEARGRGRRAREAIIERHSVERTASFIARRLEEIHGKTKTTRQEPKATATVLSSARR